ncbi:glycosyltransferase [Candidatus Methylopumilus universalis]|uniref:glycosyltransferase family 2 protein n=1 Tax=Candidatus Methylopumilus universalis TaxID=2588536 RepID=UPI001122B445|nr:glycosyltransferase [Candidatus Methylopumilus universalis]QDC89418.1 glycosyltransferase [Candidatus Methylopumilus universalis]QDC90719.1 glycosyltransferase [Candidatus Methylopumilus universalis]
MIKPPFFSVIIPIYNVQAYLLKCLESVSSQSFKDFEVILVDDGSSDKSSRIAYNFSKTHPFFYLLKKRNGGLASARNFGFLKARGRYICYIDSDDYIENNLLYDAHHILKNNSYDFINFGFDFVLEDEKPVRKFVSFKNKYLKGLNIFKKALVDDEIYSVAWNKIYSKNFLIKHCIKFPPIRINEDSYHSKLVSRFAKSTYFLNGVYYHALVRNSSLSRKMSLDVFYNTIRLFQYEFEYFQLNKLPPIYTQLFYAHILKLLSYLLLQSAFRIKDIEEYKKAFRLCNKANFFQYAAYPEIVKLLKFKNKVLVFLCHYPLLLRGIARFTSLFNVRPY